jgi:hypothetical protein
LLRKEKLTQGMLVKQKKKNILRMKKKWKYRQRENAENDCKHKFQSQDGVPMYEGNLNVEELMDWINAMDTNFDYEEVDEEKRVKCAVQG